MKASLIFMAALAAFALGVAPAHATWISAGWGVPGPVFVGRPTFVSASAFAPGPVFVNSPAFAAVSVSRPPLILQDTRAAVSVAVSGPSLVVQEPEISASVAVAAPGIPAGRTEIPSFAITTNVRPQFSAPLRFSVSIPRRELPTAPVGVSCPVRLPTLEERFCNTCGCGSCEQQQARETAIRGFNIYNFTNVAGAPNY